MTHTQHIYAGIGSRETPKSVLVSMEMLAWDLWKAGYTLRSGHAPGADQAFERGAGRAEIYLPWSSFERSVPIRANFTAFEPTPAAFDMAEEFHPNWKRCGRAARKFHARNCHQVLGRDLDNPVDFVVCWTRDGNATGGTGQAMRIANSYLIPIYNLYFPEAEIQLRSEFLTRA